MSYYKQSPQSPLFESIIWNKPETKLRAGKILIIGGNKHSIVAPSTAYTTALQHGAGESKVVLPDATRSYFKTSTTPSDIIFAESTPSGSFSHNALASLRSYVQWADYLLLPGDLSKNSETTTVCAELLTTSNQPATVAADAIDTFVPYADNLLEREDTLLIFSFSQLQKYSITSQRLLPLTSTLAHNLLISWLEESSKQCRATLCFWQHDTAYIAGQGDVIATQPLEFSNKYLHKISAIMSVWAMQHPLQRTKATATALTQLQL